MVIAVVLLSAGSSIVKWADTSGAVIAFWRTIATSLVWWSIQVIRHRRYGTRYPSAKAWRVGALAGLTFGANQAFFVTAVNHTSIAHAEFIVSLSPLALVPVGLLVFHESLSPRAVPFAVLSLIGLALVLFVDGGDDVANWRGDLLQCGTLVTWVIYVSRGRIARQSVGVIDFMSIVMPTALLVTTPFGLIVAGDELWTLDLPTWRSIVVLTIVTGVCAHALLNVVQRRLAVGTMSVIQVAQPALAVVWALVLLGEQISVSQLPGMALVLAGLVGFTRVQHVHRGRSPHPAAVVDAAAVPPPE